MMNKEAAIWLREHIDATPDGTKQSEAIEMAIKALEQQPCEDCISREAVMKCFKKWQPYMATRLWDYELALKDLPSVTPQPTTGRWLEVIDDTDSSGRKKNWHYKCSICGNEDSCWGEYNYCPICGAEMKGMRE
jgi:hypothetical protein